MASVRQIATQSGVSPATVSRVLNRHPDVSVVTRRKVLEAANLAGYVSPTSTRQALSVGFVSVCARRIFSLYDSLLLNGVRNGLQGGDLDIRLVELDRDRREGDTYTNFFSRRGISGVFLQTDASGMRVCEEIAAERFPCVLLADHPENPGLNYVRCDSKAASFDAIEHLIHLGHRKIAIAILQQPDGDHQDRLDGYREAHAANGLEVDESMVLSISANLDAGGHVINALMSRPTPPTAVFFTDPFSAEGALCRAQEIGLRIPEQLSIIGVDDSDMRQRVFPRMTAVCQPTEVIGFEAARWLSRVLQGEPKTAPCRVDLGATLEVNRTTAVPVALPVRFQPDGQPIV